MACAVARVPSSCMCAALQCMHVLVPRCSIWLCCGYGMCSAARTAAWNGSLPRVSYRLPCTSRPRLF
eukprot:800638-Alexandrium_andersonii.AAC.1